MSSDEPTENEKEHNGNTGEDLNRDTQTEYHVEDEISIGIALPTDRENVSFNEAGLENEPLLIEQKQHVKKMQQNSKEVCEKETIESKAEGRTWVSTYGDSAQHTTRSVVKMEEGKAKKKSCCILL